MNTTFFNELQEIHVTAWNERDREQRDSLLKKIYAEDVKMYDAGFILDGIQAVSDFIGKLIAEDPKYNFAAAKAIDPLQNSARLFGHIQTSGGMLNSMDFFLLEDGLVKHLYALMEPVVN